MAPDDIYIQNIFHNFTDISLSLHKTKSKQTPSLFKLYDLVLWDSIFVK